MTESVRIKRLYRTAVAQTEMGAITIGKRAVIIAIERRNAMSTFLILLASLLLISPAFAEKQPIDGTYDARVRTDSGTYRVPVEVEGGEVTRIIWPNGGRMRVRGAEIDGDEAYGRDSDGDRVRIEFEDLEYDDSGGDGD